MSHITQRVRILFDCVQIASGFEDSVFSSKYAHVQKLVQTKCAVTFVLVWVCAKVETHISMGRDIGNNDVDVCLAIRVNEVCGSSFDTVFVTPTVKRIRTQEGIEWLRIKSALSAKIAAKRIDLAPVSVVGVVRLSDLAKIL